MSKYRIINLFDKIFISVAVFLLVYAWLIFFIRNLFITFFLSLIFSASIVFVLFYILSKKQSKKTMAKNHIKDMEEKFLAFRLLNKKEQLLFMCTLLKSEKNLKFNKTNLTFKRDEKTYTLIIATEFEIIKEYDFINILSKTNLTDNIMIVCNDYDAKINTEIFENISIEFINKKKLYEEYFLKQNIYPNTPKMNTQNKKIPLKNLLLGFFSRSKAKSYFLFGLILIFSSIILPFHRYYLIFGSVLLIFSIICKLEPIIKNWKS